MTAEGYDEAVPRRTFDRERRARKEAERLLEEKARELFLANRKLEELNLDLEARVGRRTSDLAAAIERAEEASRAKTRFLTMMSHELRTPLATILGYADLLGEPTLSAPERSRFTAVVQRSGERLLEMIERILQIAELEEEQEAGVMRSLDLPALLEDEIDRLRPLAEERSLQLVLRADEPVPRTIRTAPGRLGAAIKAILENAVRFTEHGTVSVHVAFQRGDGPAVQAADASRTLPADEVGRLRVTISDTGGGIAPADRERIFEPFEQVEGGMTRRWDGPGLGLTIARRAARALGGDVALLDTEAGGTTFCIDVPVVAGRTGGWLRFGDGMPLPRRGPRDAAAGRPIEGLRILLAEDQAEIRWLARQLLERAGATVLEAADGDELVAAASSEVVDLVLTDLQMPRCDGYTAVRRLRDAGFDRPAIALTAHALEADMTEALAAGCDDYLVKPIDPVRLVDACVRWQGRRHETPAPTPAPGSSGPLGASRDQGAAPPATDDPGPETGTRADASGGDGPPTAGPEDADRSGSRPD